MRDQISSMRREMEVEFCYLQDTKHFHNRVARISEAKRLIEYTDTLMELCNHVDFESIEIISKQVKAKFVSILNGDRSIPSNIFKK